VKYLAPIFLLLASNAAYGGSIRYELHSLLGEHIYDGGLAIFNAATQIDTPFGFYAVEEATLVVEGRVSQGIAHGDGVIRENTIFDLLPSVSVRPSFDNSIEISAEPTPATFRFETKYPYPFVPETTPLPNPDGYPPVSFAVYLSVGPSLGSLFPVKFDPVGDTLSNGIIVDVSIIAQIESAYIVLSSANIAPEPSGIALVCGLIVLLLSNCDAGTARRRCGH
jgi:hypothetical protein